jgi:acyl-CoA thioesterase I
LKNNLKLATVALVILLAASAIAAYSAFSPNSKNPPPELIRVACVGDSITQGSAYPYDLWQMLGSSGPFTIGNYTQPSDGDGDALNSSVGYAVGNFGVGGTMVTLKSETPYMNTSTFQSALDYQPNIVIIMLGTNDAQPGVHQYNESFVDDYKTLINAFQALKSKPEIWIALPPPIFDDQGGKTSPEYLEQNVIPHIEQVANETGLPIIDVHSALAGSVNDFPDGLHPNAAAARLIADEVYKAIISQNK